jgi:hypothetical protein
MGQKATNKKIGLMQRLAPCHIDERRNEPAQKCLRSYYLARSGHRLWATPADDGLAAAIPAVATYNLFSRQITNYRATLSDTSA